MFSSQNHVICDMPVYIPLHFAHLLPTAEICGKPGGQKTKAVLLGSGLSSSNTTETKLDD